MPLYIFSTVWHYHQAVDRYRLSASLTKAKISSIDFLQCNLQPFQFCYSFSQSSLHHTFIINIVNAADSANSNIWYYRLNQFCIIKDCSFCLFNFLFGHRLLRNFFF